MSGLLYKTKCYLSSAMEKDPDGRGWRQEFEETIKDMGITCFNPYTKPFLREIEESENSTKDLLNLIRTGQYDEATKTCKAIRRHDLNLIDRSDFVIVYINPAVSTFGTIEELSFALRAKKPVFLFVEGGKMYTPIWILGMIPHRYIYDNIDEIVSVLKDIDEEKVELDGERWRLLKFEMR